MKFIRKSFYSNFNGAFNWSGGVFRSNAWIHWELRSRNFSGSLLYGRAYAFQYTHAFFGSRVFILMRFLEAEFLEAAEKEANDENFSQKMERKKKRELE